MDSGPKDSVIQVVQEQDSPGTSPKMESIAIQPRSVSLGSLPPPSKSIPTGWKARHIPTWKSPLLMLLFFITGLAMSLAHCIFYPKLSGKIIGDSSSQEEKLRFGTAFSFLAQISLAASVWTCFTQWLWRTVNKTEMSVGALNAAFGADTSVMSFLNIEMLKKLRIGSVMALFAWSLLLPPFFTPATLFVYQSTNLVELVSQIRYPAIADSDMGHSFAYSPPFERGKTQHEDDVSRTFTGPRTILNSISTATAALGEILPIASSFNSSSHNVSFFAPIIKCNEANNTEVELISSFLAAQMATRLGPNVETNSAYYAFVPTFNSSTGEMLSDPRPRQQQPSAALNQLWMTFLRPNGVVNANGTRVKLRHYQVCKLLNATYDLTMIHHHGIQNVTGTYDVREEVAFPADKPGDVSNMAQHAYSAFFWAISDQLVGKFSWYVDSSNPGNSTNSSALPSQFGVIDSQIQRSSLLGSLDLDAFFDFDEEMGLYKTANWTLSDQRLQDKALARNRTLSVLIEELSFNTTVSLMKNDLLTYTANTTVQVTQDVNRYSYKAHALFIPYALANAFSFVCVLLGFWSYMKDDVYPDKKFQDIVVAAEDPEVIQVVRNRKRSVTMEVVGDKVLWKVGREIHNEEQPARDASRRGAEDLSPDQMC